MKTHKTALITGASSGIGETFAEALAKQGLDLILVARSADKLKQIAARLSATYGHRVEVIAADLSKPRPGAALLKKVEALHMPVDLLINNAGFGTSGTFHKLDGAREHQEIMLNVAAVVDLAHTFLPSMVKRGGGGIINLASVAAFQPLPFMAVYAATKSFVLSFSHGLYGEYHKKGIHVLAVCPGPVDTPFFEATGVEGLRKTIPSPFMMTAEKVVDVSLKAFRAGDTVIVPGVSNKATAWFSRIMPRKLYAQAVAKGMKR
jgi:short-subunit dehydrogenase